MKQVQEQLENISKKISNNSTIDQKDLLVLLACALLEENGNK